MQRIENADRLREHIYSGGSFTGYLLKKAGAKDPRKAALVIIGIVAAAVLAIVGLTALISGRNRGSTAEISLPSATAADTADAAQQIVFSDLDRSLCNGVRITANPVRVRPTPGMRDSAIGEVYSTDNIIYPYLGETDDEEGKRWFRIQYEPDRAAWVSSDYAQKDYDVPYTGPDRQFADIAERYTAMGAQIAVIRGGRVTRLDSYGWADLGHRNMTDSSAIRTASLSKIVLAVNAFRLREEGVIDLNRDISEYWGFKVRNPAYLDTPITLYDLFSETSSFAYINPANYDLKKMTDTLKDSGAYDKKHEPGKPSAWAYRNFSAAAAGTTMELSMTGSLLVYSEDWMRDRMGIDASFAAGRIGDTSRVAALYSPAHAETLSAGELALRVGSTEKGESASLWAGGFTASAGDTAKIIAMLANDGEYEGQRILSAESVGMMETQLFKVKDTESGSEFVQAIPWRYREHIYGQSRLYYHTGNAYGVLSLAAYNPETKNGAVIITTGAQDVRDANGIYKVCGEMLEYAFSLADDR